MTRPKQIIPTLAPPSPHPSQWQMSRPYRSRCRAGLSPTRTDARRRATRQSGRDSGRRKVHAKGHCAHQGPLIPPVMGVADAPRAGPSEPMRCNGGRARRHELRPPGGSPTRTAIFSAKCTGTRKSRSLAWCVCVSRGRSKGGWDNQRVLTRLPGMGGERADSWGGWSSRCGGLASPARAGTEKLPPYDATVLTVGEAHVCASQRYHSESSPESAFRL